MQTRRMRNILIVAVVALVCALAGCAAPESAAPDPLAAIRARGEIRVGYFEGESAVYTDLANGELRGVFVDLMNDVAESMSIKVTWVRTEPATLADDLAAGAFDFAAAPVAATPALASRMLLTHPVAWLGHAGLVRKDSALAPASLADLDREGVRLAVLRGDALEMWLPGRMTNARVMLVPGDSPAAPLAAVQNGEADIALVDAVFAQKTLALDSSLRGVLLADAAQIHPLPWCWAARPGDARLVAFLDSVITAARSTGRLEEIARAYPVRLLIAPPWPRPETAPATPAKPSLATPTSMPKPTPKPTPKLTPKPAADGEDGFQ
ncbi:MAG: transporter substrate-binding domain-containing protein [Deltaproteobacteria bacterium]|nr:transporter substrate-binding domain-containing protein [Deltaproteobacteria bacterium]